MHNKLSYNMKRAYEKGDLAAGEDFERALQKLKTDKDQMLADWANDENLTFVRTAESTSATTISQELASTTEEMNKFQLRRHLGMDALPFDNELLKLEMKRLPQKDHPNPDWAAKGEKIYMVSIMQQKDSTKNDDTLKNYEIATGSKGKGGKGGKGGGDGIQVNWANALKKLEKEVNSLCKKFEKLMSTACRLKSKAKKNPDVARNLEESEVNLKKRVDLLLVSWIFLVMFFYSY